MRITKATHRRTLPKQITDAQCGPVYMYINGPCSSIRLSLTMVMPIVVCIQSNMCAYIYIAKHFMHTLHYAKCNVCMLRQEKNNTRSNTRYTEQQHCACLWCLWHPLQHRCCWMQRWALLKIQSSPKFSADADRGLPARERKCQ
jgi:hypothetical protein